MIVRHFTNCAITALVAKPVIAHAIVGVVWVVGDGQMVSLLYPLSTLEQR